MRIEHKHTIVFVEDMTTARAFYEGVLEQQVQFDWGTIVLYEGDLAIHDGKDLLRKVFKRDDFTKERQGRRNLEVYFETDELDAAFDRVSAAGTEIIHPVEVQEWGQRVFRCYDPDGHIVEVGAPMASSDGA